MSHHTPYLDQESQLRAQPFLLAIFPWICLSISLLFVLIYYRKSFASGCRPLRNGIWTRFGLYQWIWGYGPVNGDGAGDGDDTGETESEYTDADAGEAGDKGTEGGRSTSVTAPIPDLSNEPEINPPEIGTLSRTKSDSEPTCHNDSNSDNSTDKEEGGVSLSLSIAKYFDPTTGHLHGHVLEPPSPLLYSSRSKSEDYHNYAACTVSEEDVDLDDSVEGAVISNSNNGDHHTNAYNTAKADAGPGWVHSLVEMAVRSLQMLHDTYGNGNKDSNSGPGKHGPGLGQS